MPTESLQAKLERFSSPVEMLRKAPAQRWAFPIPPEYSTWYYEQRAWKETAVLFDQGTHMQEVSFRGPDVQRLFSEISINGFENFGKNKARQIVAANYQGYVIGDGIVFGIDEHEYLAVGYPTVPNWARYHATKNGYDIEVTIDDPTVSNRTGRTGFRFQLVGPASQRIVEKAHGGPVRHIKFFGMDDISIGGVKVRALNHTMTGVPGDDMTGLEFFGPIAAKEAFLQAILEAGAELGMQQGGARSYISATLESGWIPLPTPAIYSGDEMKEYRQWMSIESFEANGSLDGSFVSESIGDYYQTPWDLGYGRLIRLDHDFIGRSALAAMLLKPHRKKVWLRWNEIDVVDALRRQLFGNTDRPRLLDFPNICYGNFHFDSVTRADRLIGLSTFAGYTANMASVVSLAMIDEAEAIDGKEVILLWGEPDGGKMKPLVEPHVQTELRATIHTRPLV